MNPVAEIMLIQIVEQILVTIISEMQKAGMTPEQQAALHASLIQKLRDFKIPEPPQ